MKRMNAIVAQAWTQLGPRFLPFADAASAELPMSRLLRLSLFQVSVGMAVVLLNGTLNRVMIVELDVPAWLVSVMVALPLLIAPFRALIGFRSDTYRSFLGWRRVPFIWFGSLLQFGGLAIMPFALIVLSGDSNGPFWLGPAGAGLAFLLVGAGLHTTQTAGLALATDQAPEKSRPQVVALLYVMLLLGMVASSLIFGALLTDFSQVKLIQIIQGAAVLTMALNILALWKQEPRDPSRTDPTRARPEFRTAWRAFAQSGRHQRLLVAVGLGTAAFNMQDILLEPYGGQILGLSVSATTALTALLAGGSLAGFAVAAHMLARNRNPHRMAAYGLIIGIFAFSAVIFAAPLESTLLFRAGTFFIGFGGGLFGVSTLIATMAVAAKGQSGLVLGAWGAVTATAAGVAIALGGVIRDVTSELALNGSLGVALNDASVGYSAVYHLEIALLFATLVAVGPLVGAAGELDGEPNTRFGLAEFPS